MVKVVKQEYHVKKEAPKDRSLDLNTINENLISVETSSY